MRCAYAIAEELSLARRKKVGSILVAAEGGIIAEGFNGTPAGFDNSCEQEIGSNELVTKPEVLHAETNAIAKIAKSTRSSAGGTLYTTLMPCFECSKLIIQAGIRRVVFSEFYPYKGFQGTERPMGLDLLARANILVEQLDMSAHSRQYDCSHDRELEATEPVTPDDASHFGH